jgi:hypothetical protein
VPHPAHLLAVWEAGRAVAPMPETRAQLLHALARPDRSAEELLATGVGARDADLLALRRSLFGDVLDLRVRCQACADELEFSVSAADLLEATTGTDGPEQPRRFTDGEWTVHYRLPRVADLDTIASTRPEPAVARRKLVEEIVTGASRRGEPVPASELPARLVGELAAEVAAADPAADIHLRADCPECGSPFRCELDIAVHLWAELEAWARGLLTDVHLLAMSYGWTEPDVLALSPLRRRHYLELAGHG